MIHAYDKVYLDKARVALGRMLDFAIYELNYDIGDFMDLFIESGVSEQFETGDYTILVGKSGTEIAYEVLERYDISHTRISPQYTLNRTKEYWAGWALAYYQWETNMKFSDILKAVPMTDILALYSPYHEMDIRHFVDKMNELYKATYPETNLKLLRQNANLSQRELAELTDIPVRTIQQYEQRQKNISKAQVAYLVRLAKVLCCEVEDLLEKCE